MRSLRIRDRRRKPTVDPHHPIKPSGAAWGYDADNPGAELGIRSCPNNVGINCRVQWVKPVGKVLFRTFHFSIDPAFITAP